MRFLLVGFLLFMTVFTSSCARQAASNVSSAPPSPYESQVQRFKIVYEHPETKYFGGLTVLRDNATGCEYLIVTGLNGSPVVVPLQKGNVDQHGESPGPSR